MSVSLGVIGLGRMAKALLHPLIKRGDFGPENIFAVVGNADSVSPALDQLPKGVRVVSSDNPDAVEVWTAPIQLLAVKPNQLADVKSRAPEPLMQTKSSKPLFRYLLACLRYAADRSKPVSSHFGIDDLI